jgi:hypothetical protein
MKELTVHDYYEIVHEIHMLINAKSNAKNYSIILSRKQVAILCIFAERKMPSGRRRKVRTHAQVLESQRHRQLNWRIREENKKKSVEKQIQKMRQGDFQNREIRILQFKLRSLQRTLRLRRDVSEQPLSTDSELSTSSNTDDSESTQSSSDDDSSDELSNEEDGRDTDGTEAESEVDEQPTTATDTLGRSPMLLAAEFQPSPMPTVLFKWVVNIH